MASKIRVAAVQKETEIIIDKGAEIDQQLKNLGSEDKSIKALLVDASKTVFEADETSVNLKGGKACAMITKKKGLKVKFASDGDKDNFVKAVFDGDLVDVVKVGINIDVNTARLKKLLEILKAESFDSELSFDVDKKGYEATIAKSGKVAELLKKTVEEGETLAVKYTWND